jgi:hypothetical protein
MELRIIIENLICKAYIIKEISIFISCYFKSHIRTRINYNPIHDDGVEVPF